MPPKKVKKTYKRVQKYLSDYPWTQYLMSSSDKSRVKAIIRANVNSQKPNQNDPFSITNFVHFVIDELAKERKEWLQLDVEQRHNKVPKFKDIFDYTERVLVELVPVSPERKTG